MIHTPHRDKKRGTTRSMDVIEEHGLSPTMVVIDHNNEETVREVLDRGYWAAFSIYPSTKMGNERMVEIVRQYGAKRVIVDSACDWGISEPLGVAKTAKLALQRGIPEEQVRLICYQNALDAYGQSGQMRESDWLDPPEIDQHLARMVTRCRRRARSAHDKHRTPVSVRSFFRRVRRAPRRRPS